MIRTMEEAIAPLSDAEKIQLIEQFEQFEQDGQIGECELRTIAKTLPGCGYNVVVYMSMVAHECYRYFYNKWKDSNGKND